MVSEPIH